jgi:hypothetical protein
MLNAAFAKGQLSGDLLKVDLLKASSVPREVIGGLSRVLKA